MLLLPELNDSLKGASSCAKLISVTGSHNRER